MGKQGGAGTDDAGHCFIISRSRTLDWHLGDPDLAGLALRGTTPLSRLRTGRHFSDPGKKTGSAVALDRLAGCWPEKGFKTPPHALDPNLVPRTVPKDAVPSPPRPVTRIKRRRSKTSRDDGRGVHPAKVASLVLLTAPTLGNWGCYFCVCRFEIIQEIPASHADEIKYAQICHADQSPVFSSLFACWDTARWDVAAFPR